MGTGRSIGGAIRAVLIACALAGWAHAQPCTIDGPPESFPGPVFVDGTLVPGFDVGVDTDKQERMWLTCGGDVCPDCCRMQLPPGQQWGAVFITVGPPVQPPRPAVDVTAFECVGFQLRLVDGIGLLDVGLKDACDPDTGVETKRRLDLAAGSADSEGWISYSYPLTEFESADPRYIHVPLEFVFDVNFVSPEPPQTIDFRSIRFTTAPCVPEPTATATPSSTGTSTPSATPPATATAPPSPSGTPTTAEGPPTPTPTASAAATPTPPHPTSTSAPLSSPTQAASESPSPSPTETPPATATPAITATDTAPATPTDGAPATPTTSSSPASSATPTPSAPVTVTLTPSASPTVTATPPLPTAPPGTPCVGDCNGDGAIAVDEIVRGVNIALGLMSTDTCREFDDDVDGRVTIAELLRAVNAALGGCTAPTPARVSYQVHGLNFGPFVDGQDPNRGVPLGPEQVRARLVRVAPYTEWVRSFGSTNGLESIGPLAHSMGLKAAVGAWLGREFDANERELASLISLASEGAVDMAIVGSETLLRGDLTPAQLVSYLDRTRQAIPATIPVTTADTCQRLLQAPQVLAHADIVFVNDYPYFAGVPVHCGVAALHFCHRQLTAIADGKPVIVSESGWPSCGEAQRHAVPSPENASFYFLNLASWARALNVPLFYFEAFDETWKATYEGAIGACWGVWDKRGRLKPGNERVFHGHTLEDNWSDPRASGCDLA